MISRSRRLEEVGQCPILHQDAGIVLGYAQHVDEALVLRIRQLGKLGPYFFHPASVNGQRRQVWFREIAIIVCLLLAALREGALMHLIPSQRLLHHRATSPYHVDLALDLVGHGPGQSPKTVEVFDFRACPQLMASAWAHGDVRLETQDPLLHVATVDAEVAEDPPNFPRVGMHRGH